MLIERWPFVKGTRFIGSGSAITTTMRDCSPDQFRAITYPHHSFSPQSQQLGPTAQVEPLHFKINSSRKGALKWNLTFRLKLTSAGQRLRSFYGKNACAMKSTWHSEAWTGDSLLTAPKMGQVDLAHYQAPSPEPPVPLPKRFAPLLSRIRRLSMRLLRLYAHARTRLRGQTGSILRRNLRSPLRKLHPHLGLAWSGPMIDLRQSNDDRLDGPERTPNSRIWDRDERSSIPRTQDRIGEIHD